MDWLPRALEVWGLNSPWGVLLALTLITGLFAMLVIYMKAPAIMIPFPAVILFLILAANDTRIISGAYVIVGMFVAAGVILAALLFGRGGQQGSDG